MGPGSLLGSTTSTQQIPGGNRAATVAMSLVTTSWVGGALLAAIFGASAQFDFESGDLSDWQDIQRASRDRISVVADPVRRGERAGRFEVRGGDSTNGTARSEVASAEDLSSEGETQAFVWSTRLPADYPLAATWQTLVQWKNEGEGVPPLQLQIQGDQIGLIAGPQEDYRWLWQTPLERDRWLDFEVRVRWSANPKLGWVEAWHQGRKVLDREPMATLYPGLTNYLKMGLYRDESIQETGVVYHDEMTVYDSPFLWPHPR